MFRNIMDDLWTNFFKKAKDEVDISIKAISVNYVVIQQTGTFTELILAK